MNYKMKLFNRYKNMRIVSKVYSAHIVVTLLGLIICIFFIIGMSTISRLTDKMYYYPYIIANNVYGAQKDILQIKNEMMDNVLFKKGRADIELAISRIEDYKDNVDNHFRIIEERMTDEKGKELIAKAKDNFKDWKAIIDEVTHLITNRSSSEALLIMKGWSQKHVGKLIELMDLMSNHTDELAMNFHIDANTASSKVKSISLISTIVLIVIIIFISIFISKNIKLSVSSAIDTIKDITKNGDLSQEIKIMNRDEMGEIIMHLNELLNSLRDLRDQAKSISDGNLTDRILDNKIIGDLGEEFSKMVYNLKLLANQAKAISEGDLKNEILDNRIDGDLGDAFFSMKENLKSIVGSINYLINITSSTVNEISAISEEMAGAANTQVDMISDISSSFSQLTGSIKHVADNAGIVSLKAGENTQIAERAKSLTEKAIDMVISTKKISDKINDTFMELQRKAENISDIINIILNIADKSDLLALNASIEASSAGESGRRFSVVASEMRKLSERISLSTGDIEKILKEIQDSIGESAGLIKTEADDIENTGNIIMELESVFKGLYNDFSDTSKMMIEVSTATEEQRITTESLKGSVEEMNISIQETTNAAEGTARAAVELMDNANTLIEYVKRFKL
ncbi:MAG: methyl-accepting chemotaxis protein [Spirochaetota bacterium]|nr:methyl-accepting chemotaxis protein [Spirochaetota bacterium]